MIAVVILVAILVIALTLGALAAKRYENFISGLWIGDPGFLERAQLKDMQLFLAPAEGGVRQGYLIMTDLQGEFVSNQALEVREKSSARRWWTALKSVFRTGQDVYTASKVEFVFDDAETGADPPMPPLMKMSVSMIDGSLTLYDGEKVYAFLGKDPAASAAAVEAYSS